MEKLKHTNDDGRNVKIFLRIIGLGLVLMIGIVIIFNYTQSQEYPKLLYEDSLSDKVLSVETDRSVAFVTFEGNKKYEIPWAQNFQYEKTFNLSSLISSGDSIIKKPFSDTIKVKHSGKEYVFVLKHTIK